MSKNRYRGSKLTSVFLLAILIFSGLSPITLFTSTASAASASIVVDPATYSGSGTTITDTVSSINGTMSNVTFESSTNCGVFNYNGSNSAIQFPQRNFGTAFSISTWIRASQGATTGQPQFNIQTLMSNVGANVAPSGFKVFINNWNSNDGKLIHQAGNNSTGTDVYSNDSNLVSINQWHHIVFTFNQSSPAVSIYKDGTKLNTTGTPVSNIGMNNSNWWLGSMGGNSYWYNGKMGITKIYQTVLNQTEVTEDYNSTSARYASTPTCPTSNNRSVTYALNSGTGSAPTQADTAQGSTFTVASDSGISRSGFTFAGWRDGSTTYQPNATYTAGSSNITLTAQWTANDPTTTTFNATGAAQTWTVPAGITSLSFSITGGSGGDTHGGKGATVTGTLAVTAGETLQLNVGARGGTYPGGSTSNWTSAAFGGGGRGNYYGSGGGGASDIRKGSYALADRVAVAGGGGGGAEMGSYYAGNGGTTSGGNGQPATANNLFGAGGGGATQSAGGTGGTGATSCGNRAGSSGTLGVGGDGAPASSGSAGGGGGYYGGGAGGSGCNAIAGGGGSSWVSSSLVTSSAYSVAASLSAGTISLTYGGLAPTLTGAVISGTASQGQTLTASVQGAAGGTATTTAYQWKSSADNSTYSDISSATNSTYVLTSSEVGKYIKVFITVSNSINSNSATSSATSVVATIAPTISSLSISGTAKVGETLTATSTLGGGTATSTTYQWKVADTATGTYSDISGATSSTFTLTTAEAGKFIKVYLVASNGVGSNNQLSSATAGVGNLTLSVSSISASKGGAITSLTSTAVGGTSTSFSISPSLPSGLSLNTTTGTVSGTPTGFLTSTTYTITANGTTGAPTATFTLVVAGTALSNASAPTVSATSGTTESITITFTSVANATSHTVRLYQNDGTTLISTNTSFTSGGTLTGLTANTAYKVSLQAIGDGTTYITSAESSKASVTTGATAASPTISSHPANTAANVGSTATISVTNAVSDGGTRTYQWQTSTDGSTWSNVGSSSASYTTSTLTFSNNGLLIRVVITNSKNGTTASTTSNNATLTVNLLTLSTPQIYSYNLGISSTSSISATWGAVTNAVSYTARVFLSDGTTLVSTTTNISSGGTITGLTPNTAYKFSIQAIGNGTTYSQSSQSGLYSLTTNRVAVTPTISTHPAGVTKSAGSTATFTVAAARTDSGTLSYQWQTSPDNSTWTNVGTNSTSYTTGTLSNSDGGLEVRVVVTNTKSGTTATATSNSAIISIATYNVLMTTQSETNTSSDYWIIRGNVRVAHQFTAGGAAAINIFKIKLSATQNYPSQVKIVIYSDSSNTIGSVLGELTYDSISSLNATYTGSVSIPSAGSYWFEIQPTESIANHYYNGTSSTASTGSASGWSQNRTARGSSENSVTWSYSSGTSTYYPLVYIGTIGSIITSGSVTSISPSSGPATGSTVVTIIGTVLDGTTGVTFGGTSGTSLTINSATSITVTTPSHATGVVDVVVTTSTKTITVAGGFTYFGAPTIPSASISGTANSGQTLTATPGILGGGTASSTTYKWQAADSAAGTYSDISGATSSSFVLTDSEVNKYLKVVITVTNAVGSNSATSSATAQIATLLTAPTLTGAAISGTTTQGQTLTASIQGAGGGAASTTTYQWSRADTSTGTYSNISGATSSTYVLGSADATKFIKVTISVSNSAGGPNSATSSATNQIAIIAPTIGSATFSGTTTVGQMLTASSNSLGGGAVASTTYQWRSATTAAGVYSDISGATSNTYLLTANEAGKYIRVVITVTNTAASASATSNASSAAVISNVPTPTISSISPSAGTTAGGTSVTISGTNLSTVTTVTFDGTAATISTKTSTQLVVTTPAHSAGAVDVVVTNTAGSVTSANGFTYAATPTTRSWTATPTITSGANGDPFSVTYLAVCTTPQRFGPSMYDLIYITPGVWIYNTYMGSGTSTDGGYTWTITKNYTINSNGIWKIDAYQRGACWGTSNFTYATQTRINVGVSGPTITSLSTTSGPTAGGAATTITGTNLTGVTGITVGGTAATSIRSNNSTSVTFNTPAGTAGAKNVVVTTTGGSVTGTNAFTYVAAITITYDVNGGSGSPSRTSDSYTPNTGGYSVPVVGTMTRAGYTFGGWATAIDSSTAITSPYNPTSLLTVYAIWTAKNYTNSYNTNGADTGTAPTASTNAFGSTVTVAGNSGTLAKDGYTLAGWDTAADASGTSYILGSGTFTQGSANQILYAEWVPITYTVSYNVNGSSDAAPSSHTNKVANSSVTLAAGVTKASFAFVGWETDGVTYKSGATFALGASDAVMTAKWIAVFKLSYNLNGTGATGSVPADFQYASGDSVTVTSVVPVRAGYTFSGWVDQSAGTHATSSSYVISGTNYLLYAAWSPISYTTTYALNGAQGTAPTQTNKNVNDTFVVATAPTKAGSTFTGWSDGTKVYGSGSNYLVETANITLTAQWTANSYAITYDLAQGTSSVPSAVSKNYQASWNLPDAPTRVGYNFADWYDGTNGYAAGVSYTLGTATDLTLTARWNAIVFYTVTYDLDGGLGNAPTQDPLQNGQTFTLPSDPAKTGNSFTGWSYAGTTYSAGQVIPMPAANVTVTALWTATSAGTFAITYITNGAQTAAPTVPPLTENSTFTIDDGSGLIKNGYIFSGWSRSGTIYLGGETFTMPASSVTFSAVWVPSVRATAVTHSADSTSITRGRSITVTYSLGCYVFSSTIPTIFENVSTTGESFINDITSSLTVIDAGYNWTVTRVYTLSLSGTYTIFATASGGCFGTSTDSTSSTVTVTDPPTSSAGTSSGATTPAPETATTSTPARTGSIQPVTVVGAKIALVANRTYTLPKLSAPTLSVEARTGASSSSSTTTTQTNGTSLTTTTMLSVNFASKGLSEVKIVENQIAVIPTVGFSGKTDVTVTVTDGTSTTTITVPVTVLPEPVKDPMITPIAARQTSVTWEASPNANSYQVIVDGKTACKAATDSCEVKKILGPNADVQVIANGGDATKSDAVDADYEANKTVVLTKLVGTTKGAILTPNDINMLNKVIATVKAQGFETVTISQITTTRVNSAAAKARINALVNYVKSRSGDPDLVVTVVPAPAKTSMNQIAVK